MTYAELDSWSNRLARVLLAHGAGPDRFVVLALPRSVESIVALWAVAKTGAAFAPLDPNHPPERIEHMIADSRAGIGVTTTAIGASLPGTIDWLLLDDLATVRKTMTVSDAPVTDADRGDAVHPHQVAYLIYTSGSTGKPKAVLLGHAGLANLVQAQCEYLGLDETSAILQVASPSFDAAVADVLEAAGSAARLVIAAPDVYGGDALANLLRTERVTHAGHHPVGAGDDGPRGPRRPADPRRRGRGRRSRTRRPLGAGAHHAQHVRSQRGHHLGNGFGTHGRRRDRHHRHPDPWGHHAGARHLAAAGAARTPSASCTSPGRVWRAATSAASE